VSQGITIRVPCGTFFKGNLYAAQDELAPARQAMEVIADADAVMAIGRDGCSKSHQMVERESDCFFPFLTSCDGLALLRDVKPRERQIRRFSNLDVSVRAHQHFFGFG
jgi:hypothetical protein